MDLFRAVADEAGLEYEMQLGPWPRTRRTLEAGKIGMIEVESEPGEGSAFQVLLPRAPAPAAPQEAEPPAPAGERRRAVLVVEDDADVRELAAALPSFAAGGALATEQLQRPLSQSRSLDDS